MRTAVMWPTPRPRVAQGGLSGDRCALPRLAIYKYRFSDSRSEAMS
jgi:hypothetical protein